MSVEAQKAQMKRMVLINVVLFIRFRANGWL